MSDPISWMIQHREAVKAVWDESGESLKGSFDLMCARIPAVSQVMKVNTWRVIVRPVMMATAAMQEEIDALQKENARLRSDPLPDDPAPEHIDGWKIRKAGKYWRAAKRVAGSVRTVYLGKRFDLLSAKEKIRAKERALAG